MDFGDIRHNRLLCVNTEQYVDKTHSCGHVKFIFEAKKARMLNSLFENMFHSNTFVI